jgi:hypothetical protein
LALLSQCCNKDNKNNDHWGRRKPQNQNLPGKKKKKTQSPENREKNRTMKNSLSVIDKQIKENRSKIALTTSATEEEEERRAKHKAGNTRAREHQYQRQTRERGERIEIAHFRVNAHQHRPILLPHSAATTKP